MLFSLPLIVALLTTSPYPAAPAATATAAALTQQEAAR